MSISTKLPEEFELELFELIDRLLPVDGIRFRVYVPGIDLSQEIGSDVEIDQMTKDYSSEFWKVDPMHPSNFEHTNRTVVTNSELMTNSAWENTDIYKNFFAPHDYFHNADVFFRYEERIIGVLTVLRKDPDKNFTPTETRLLKDIQPFLEFSLSKVYLPKRTHNRESLAKEFSLTSRELDVVEVALTGASNKELVQKLKISLPTLRTHIQNIYRKTDVHSNSELISKVLNILR